MGNGTHSTEPSERDVYENDALESAPESPDTDFAEDPPQKSLADQVVSAIPLLGGGQSTESKSEDDDANGLMGDDDEPALYDPSVLDGGAKFEDDSVRIITEIARDESLPNIVHYIENIGKLSFIAKARLIARAACFQSKNYVYSNISDNMDMMRVQDDFELVRLVSRIGLPSFDRNVDYLTAEALIESEHNIRIRRSKGALNLTMINTQRTESTSIQKVKADEEKKIRSKLSFINGGF